MSTQRLDGVDVISEAADGQAAAVRLLTALSAAVRRRVCNVPEQPSPRLEADGAIGGGARVAVLFSGGIDCMVLARLADLHLPTEQPIDLINVAFGDLAAEAPDRQSGRAGVAELRMLSRRRFNLIEVDVSFFLTSLRPTLTFCFLKSAGPGFFFLPLALAFFTPCRSGILQHPLG